MADFPMQFKVTTQAISGISEKWTAKENDLPQIECSIPPEFHGPGGGYSPEGLFGLSIISCTIAMFKVLCEKFNVQFSNLEGTAIIIMDYATTEKILAITEIDTHFKVFGASDTQKVKEILEKAINSCPIGHSIKCGKTYHIDIT